MMRERLPREIDRRVAVVTGGSRGIGTAIALALAREKFDVAVGYSGSPSSAEACVQEIERIGRHAVAVHADLIDPSGAEAVMAQTLETFSQVDVLINNAGVGVVQDFADLSIADWDRTMNINARSAFRLSQLLIPPMAKRGWGRVVFISSIVAFTGGIVGADYAASKAALLGLTRYLAATFASAGVTVNAVAPGFIETDMLPGGEAARTQLIERVPLRRLGTAQEVADLVVMLVNNAYITGQTVVIDGGRYFH